MRGKILLLAFLLLSSVYFTNTVKKVSGPVVVENFVEIKNKTTAEKEVSTTTAKVTTTTSPGKTSGKKEVLPSTATQKTAVVTQKPPEPATDFEAINTFARQSVVNILCETGGSDISSISGSGVVISPQGVILTNAHIAQYFLLRDYLQKDYVKCTIRTGSPAYPKYKAELLYIPPSWIEKNSSMINQTDPKGTGENDFALLRITGEVNGNGLSSPMPYLFPNTAELLEESQPVVLVSYPAGFLGGQFILRDLNITSAVTMIQDIFTFEEATVDLISVGGTIISQKGSSGGAVVDKKASMIGLIVTSSTAPTTGERDLRAITLAYISRNMKNELGISLIELLSSDIASFSKKFQETVAPAMTKLLTDELNKN